MLTDAEMFNRMKNGWHMGKPFTVCGNGSTLENTRTVRAWLPDLVARLGIKTLADAGAGDCRWIRRVDWRGPLVIRSYDLIPRVPGVIQWDVTAEQLPNCDAILCRFVLNHLMDDVNRVNRTIALFRQAAPYLIATQFRGEHLRRASPQFARLDLRGEPFNLGEPLEAVRDGPESECHLAVWRLC